MLANGTMRLQRFINLFVLFSLAAVLLAGAVPVARGEVFLLKGGGRIEAEQLNPARTPTEPYQVRTPLGMRLVLSATQVQRVVVKSQVQKQYDEQLPKVANTAEAHWQMAQWCKEAGLTDERKRHLAAVLAIDPDHAEARAALGYARIRSGWMTQDEYLTSQGYIRHGGAWKLPQQIELETAGRERELAEKALRKQILIWIDQLDGSRRDEAARNLLALRDPRAAAALIEILVDAKQPLELRRLCLEILGKLPPGLATGALIKLAMDEKDATLRDKCLDELVRAEAIGAVAVFTGQLTSKDNKRVNRAATCLERMGATDATLPLINALVTTHEYILVPAGGSGGINFNSAGGLSMGGKPQKKKADQQNAAVLSALTSLHQGINYSFDEGDWRRWYIETFSTTQVDLRRDE